MSDLYSNIDRE